MAFNPKEKLKLMQKILSKTIKIILIITILNSKTVNNLNKNENELRQYSFGTEYS